MVAGAASSRAGLGPRSLAEPAEGQRPVDPDRPSNLRSGRDGDDQVAQAPLLAHEHAPALRGQKRPFVDLARSEVEPRRDRPLVETARNHGRLSQRRPRKTPVSRPPERELWKRVGRDTRRRFALPRLCEDPAVGATLGRDHASCVLAPPDPQWSQPRRIVRRVSSGMNSDDRRTRRRDTRVAEGSADPRVPAPVVSCARGDVVECRGDVRSERDCERRTRVRPARRRSGDRGNRDDDWWHRNETQHRLGIIRFVAPHRNNGAWWRRHSR